MDQTGREGGLRTLPMPVPAAVANRTLSSESVSHCMWPDSEGGPECLRRCIIRPRTNTHKHGTIQHQCIFWLDRPLRLWQKPWSLRPLPRVASCPPSASVWIRECETLGYTRASILFIFPQLLFCSSGIPPSLSGDPACSRIFRAHSFRIAH